MSRELMLESPPFLRCFTHGGKDFLQDRRKWGKISSFWSMSWGAFQVALVIKNPPVNAGDRREAGLICGLGRSPGGGNGNSIQYFCLENATDRGGWQATVHRITESDTTEAT